MKVRFHFVNVTATLTDVHDKQTPTGSRDQRHGFPFGMLERRWNSEDLTQPLDAFADFLFVHAGVAKH
jgi:hypothetical protein